MHPFASKFVLLRRLARLGAVGAILVLIGAACRFVPTIGNAVVVVGCVAILPLFVFAYVLTILHWKARYRGSHSDLWGVVLLLEASGWSKVLYLFRHVLPDMRRRGRYTQSPEA